jgi:hypothetical protein
MVPLATGQGLSVCYDCRSMSKRPAQTEIEITAAMIEAGREAMSARWLDFVGPEGFRLWDIVLSETFAAMWAARPEFRA